MQIGLAVEIRCPLGSVAFQAEIPVDPVASRVVRKTLAPGEVMAVPVYLPVRDIALIAGQAQLAAVVDVDGERTVLEGQKSTDFGLLYAVRGDEAFGDAPWPVEYDDNPDTVVRTLKITNTSGKQNPVTVMVCQRQTEPVIDPAALPTSSAETVEAVEGTTSTEPQAV